MSLKYDGKRAQTIGKIERAIINAIDKECQINGYMITYNEIQAALINIIKQINSDEFKEEKGPKA